MTSRAAMVRWSLIGASIALLLLVAQASAVGGWEGLLQVGESSALRPLIEEELGSVPLAEGSGHDGQIYYAIAIDLDASTVPRFLEDDAHRYRRILYPLVSSLGGLLRGHALLYSMTVVTILATAVAAGSVAATAVRWNRSEWFALAVLLNPGVWLSIRLLTADMLALALMVVAISQVVSSPNRTTVSLTLSAFSKEAFVVTAMGLGVDRRQRAWRVVVVPLAGILLWALWLEVTLGGSFAAGGNLTVPIVGIVEASSMWALFDLEEWFYLVFALASLAAGVVTSVMRKSWLRWSILVWTFLGLISSHWVWRFGNNAARVLAPIVILAVLSYIPVSWETRPAESGSSAGAG